MSFNRQFREIKFPANAVFLRDREIKNSQSVPRKFSRNLSPAKIKENKVLHEQKCILVDFLYTDRIPTNTPSTIPRSCRVHMTLSSDNVDQNTTKLQETSQLSVFIIQSLFPELSFIKSSSLTYIKLLSFIYYFFSGISLKARAKQQRLKQQSSSFTRVARGFFF